MIQQRADALVARIKRQKELRAHVDRLVGFRTQAGVIAAAIAQIEPLVTIRQLFSDRAITGTVTAPDASPLLKALEQLRLGFAETPTFILAPNRLQAIKGTLPPFAAALTQQLLGNWQAYALGQVPGVNREVLKVLEGLSALRAQVRRVVAGMEELEARTQRLPSSGADIDAFERTVADVHAAWNELDTSHLPPEVLQFLKEAGGATGAALGRLTGPVQQWLQEHRLTASFRIRQVLT